MSEFTTEQRRRVLSSLDPDLLELIILPTEKCNFRCKYCYEDFALGKMSPKVVSGIKSLIEQRSKGLRRLHISWFGGEPLVAKDVVLDISRFAMECSEDYGFDYSGSMTTNGYLLTPDLQADLVGFGIGHYQISLDGDEKHHDLSRPLASGRGTHRTIMENLAEILSSDRDFTVTLRLHITNYNAEDVYEYYQKIKNSILRDKRVRLFVKAIANLGGPLLEASALPDKTAASNVKDKIIADYGQRTAATSETNIEDVKICYAARPNSFVIRSDGEVAKCTVAFRSQHNKVGKIEEDGKLGLNVENLAKWMQGFKDFNKAALHCPAQELKLW